MSQNTEEQRTPDEELLNVVKVGRFTIMPFSFGKMALITPKLQPLMEKIIQQFPNKNYTTIDIIRCVMVLLPELTPILAVALDITEKEVNELPASEATQLIVAIVSANQGILMNFFTLASMAVSMAMPLEQTRA